jgi:ubiquinone/menaquinone biosynthesis C-methylase UbiE
MRKQLAAAVSEHSRRRKVAWLRMNIKPGASVLMVGASGVADRRLGTDNAVERGVAEFTTAHALVYGEGNPHLGCPYSSGDACRLPFADDSFDYVVSNAVIEHVGGPERAQSMLSESRRVARLGAFHTTPDRWFPIETHTQLAFVHWLPRRLQARAFRAVGRPYWNTGYYWLYGRRSFAALDSAFAVERLSPVTLVAAWWG